MDKKSDRVILETSSFSFFIAITVVLLPVFTLALKGQSPLIYMLSFVIGNTPVTVVGLFRPLFNPYVNFWTRRSENSLSQEEISNLELLKGPEGKKAVLEGMLAVACLLTALYFGIYFLSQKLIMHPRNTYEAAAVGSFFTFWLTFGYQIFFLSRVIRRREMGSRK